MHFFFIDESQTAPKPNSVCKVKYFVLAGVAIPEDQWRGIAQELKKLMEYYKVKGEVKWRFFGPTNKDESNPFLKMDMDTRHLFRKSFYSIISKRKSVRIIAAVTDIRKAYSKAFVNDEEDLYSYTYKRISERFQYFLQDLERNVGSKQNGIIIADHRGRAQDEGLRIRHHAFLDGNEDFSSTYNNILETVFFTPSHHSVGIQVADMVAGAISRKYNSSDDTYFKEILPLFRRSPTGEIAGWGLISFPKT